MRRPPSNLDRMGIFKKKTNLNAPAVQSVKPAAPSTAAKAAAKKDNTGHAYRVLLRPLVTEKASTLTPLNQYVFAVATTANKRSVAEAVYQVYGVRPTRVNIIVLRGKHVRSGRTAGRRSDWKKAIVSLPAGKTISIYEGV